MPVLIGRQVGCNRPDTFQQAARDGNGVEGQSPLNAGGQGERAGRSMQRHFARSGDAAEPDPGDRRPQGRAENRIGYPDSAQGRAIRSSTDSSHGRLLDDLVVGQHLLGLSLGWTDHRYGHREAQVRSVGDMVASIAGIRSGRGAVVIFGPVIVNRDGGGGVSHREGGRIGSRSPEAVVGQRSGHRAGAVALGGDGGDAICRVDLDGPVGPHCHEGRDPGGQSD